MTVRPTMASLISRVRQFINDPAPPSAQFQDQEIQDILDASRQQARYLTLNPSPTYSGAQLSFLEYYSDLGDWEDDLTLWQYRINAVAPSASENIVGHWTFAANTVPPVYIIGKTYDVYRASADLLERLAARYMLAYTISVDGQSLQRSQMMTMMLDLAHTYRLKQRVTLIGVVRTDINSSADGGDQGINLAPRPIDYYSPG